MASRKSTQQPDGAAGRESTLERWTYIGRRELGDGKLGAVYLDEHGERLVFSLKLRAGAIGAIYEAKVVRREDGVSVIGDPQYVEPPADDDRRVGEWEAEDRAAYTAGELRKSEQRTQREGRERFGALTLAELRVIYRRQPPGRDAALLAQVLRYLGAA